MFSLWKSSKVFVLSAVMFSAGVGAATVGLSYLPSVIATPGMVEGGVKQGSRTEKAIEENGFRFDLQNCQRSGQIVTCNFLITNLRNQNTSLRLDANAIGQSRILDFSGNEYIAKQTLIGSEEPFSYTKAELIPNIPVKANITFELPQEVTKAAAFEVHYYTDSSGVSKLQLRNVSLDGSQISNSNNPTNPACNCTCPLPTNPKKQ